MSNKTLAISMVVKDGPDGLKTLTMDANALRKAMGGALGEAKKMRKSLKDLGAVSLGLDAISGALSSLQGMMKGLTDAYDVQVEAETKLETVMRQRMSATEAEIQSIKDLCSAQQQLGVIGDEVQLAGAQQVSTFLQTREALETLIPAMNNLVAQQRGLNATSGDAVNIGNLLGKAMQGQTAALRRVGITFTEAEERTVKYGTMTAPLAVAWMVRYFPWQDVFIIAGVVGLAIAGLWWIIYCKPQPEFLAMTLDEPTAKVKNQRYFKLGALFGTSALWGVILIRLVSDPVWYFINFWLPGYLRNLGVEQGMGTQETLDMIQYIGGIPFLVGATLGVLASAYSDRLVSRGWNSLRSRKVVMSLSACVAPIIALVPMLSHWEGVAFSVRLGLITAVFAIVAFVCLVWLYNIGVVVAESFPVKNVASVIGIACGAGAVGAACFNLIVGSLMSTMGEYLFYCMGALHPIAAFVLIKLVKPAVPDSKNSIEDSKDSSIDNDVCGLDAAAN